MEITPELFEQQRSRRFGNANPERIQVAFWEWMIRGGDGPYRVRELFNAPFKNEDGPIWTFDRMGTTRSQLPDGRSISVGGEYEDYFRLEKRPESSKSRGNAVPVNMDSSFRVCD